METTGASPHYEEVRISGARDEDTRGVAGHHESADSEVECVKREFFP